MAIRSKPTATAARARQTPWERFPFAILPVTYIAEQCYCEHRVHLWLEAPGARVSVPRSIEGKTAPARRQAHLAEAGTALHEKMVEGVPRASQSAARKLVRSGHAVGLLEWPFYVSWDELTIAGIPDAVCFEGGKVRCVIEYKRTNSNQLQMSHRVQLQLYGWLLQESGFKPSDALMVCVIVPGFNAATLDGMDEAYRQKLAGVIHEKARGIVEAAPERVNWFERRVELGDGFWVRLRIIRYDRQRAVDELTFFSGYWRGARSAIPSRNPKKCSTCLYNGQGSCKVAAAPFVERP